MARHFQKWNADLAKLAYDWAKHCSFEYGRNDLQVNNNTTKFYGGGIGRLVHTSERLFEPKDIIKEWYTQKEHYHYDINACDIHSSCEKYTQVMRNEIHPHKKKYTQHEELLHELPWDNVACCIHASFCPGFCMHLLS